MSRRILAEFRAVLCTALFVAGCTRPDRSITIADLEASLPRGPINVGFDVDETLICSTPVWYYLATNHDGPGGTNKYGGLIRRHPDFWPDANRLDSFSLPKQAAKDLLAMHRRRGDRITIITSRMLTPGEQLTATLRRDFDLDESVPIRFTSQKPKLAMIREAQLAVFYGDSDDDMRDARAAGARPIRILRSLRCANDALHIGVFGEEVLAGSDVCVGFARGGAATRPVTRSATVPATTATTLPKTRPGN